MSPTIFKKNGYRLYFYSNEHEPKHVHVEKGDKGLKYDLENNEVIKNYGMKKIEINAIISIIEDNKNLLINEWDKYFTKK